MVQFLPISMQVEDYTDNDDHGNFHANDNTTMTHTIIKDRQNATLLTFQPYEPKRDQLSTAV